MAKLNSGIDKLERMAEAIKDRPDLQGKISRAVAAARLNEQALKYAQDFDFISALSCTLKAGLVMHGEALGGPIAQVQPHSVDYTVTVNTVNNPDRAIKPSELKSIIEAINQK